MTDPAIIDGIPQWSMGERMAKARRCGGYTQESFAEMLCEHGFRATPASIASWESDRSQPRDLRKLLETWEEITGVKASWIFGL